MIPIESETKARTLGPDGYVRFSSVSSVLVDNSRGEFFGTAQQGTLDVVALEVEPYQVGLARHIRERSVMLPPTGDWFINSMKFASKNNFNVPLIASGFPKQGTESSIDYEAMRVISQGVRLVGDYAGIGQWPHTHCLRLRRSDNRIEPDGMSGGPVYMRMPNGDDAPYYLTGMTLRGGHGSDLIHFCTVNWLTAAIDGIKVD